MVKWHTDQKNGWAYDTAEDKTDPIGAEDPYYEYGIDTQRAKNELATPNITVNPVWRGGSREPAYLAIAKKRVPTRVGFWLVNALPIFWLYGTSVTTTGEHVLSDGLSQPSMVHRWQSENDTENLRYSAVWSKLSQLSLQYDRLEGSELFCVTEFEPMKLTSAYNADKTPVFPDSISSLFDAQAGLTVTWDQGGDNVDYSNDLLSWNWTPVTMNKLRQISSDSWPGRHSMGDIAHGITMTILTGTDTSIFKDFLSQDPDALMDLRIKFGSATKYLQLDFAEVLQIGNKIQKVAAGDEVKTVYQVTAIPRLCVPKSKDGITSNSTFYGE